MRLAVPEFTYPGEQFTEVTHTPWFLLMWRICMKFVETMWNCQQGPSVGCWNPLMDLLTVARSICASCMIVQSGHPVGEALIRNSLWPRIPRDLCFSDGLYIVLTKVTSSFCEHDDDCAVGKGGNTRPLEAGGGLGVTSGLHLAADVSKGDACLHFLLNRLCQGPVWHLKRLKYSEARLPSMVSKVFFPKCLTVQALHPLCWAFWSPQPWCFGPDQQLLMQEASGIFCKRCWSRSTQHCLPHLLFPLVWLPLCFFSLLSPEFFLASSTPS